ncbi:hypothetical protein LINPERHAP1_LOCUS3310 [Linum perenne]
MDETAAAGGKSPSAATRPPDSPPPPIPNSFSPPDASSLPRKRPREELPNPICEESDLTRSSPPLKAHGRYTIFTSRSLGGLPPLMRMNPFRQSSHG